MNRREGWYLAGTPSQPNAPGLQEGSVSDVEVYINPHTNQCVVDYAAVNEYGVEVTRTIRSRGWTPPPASVSSAHMQIEQNMDTRQRRVTIVAHVDMDEDCLISQLEHYAPERVQQQMQAAMSRVFEELFPTPAYAQPATMVPEPDLPEDAPVNPGSPTPDAPAPSRMIDFDGD
jgi:hypothetical protein